MWISMVVLLLAGAVFFASISLRSQNKEYAQQEAELQEQIAAQEERTKEIEEYKEYMQSDEYVKQEAREKLGLVMPGEVVFEPEE